MNYKMKITIYFFLHNLKYSFITERNQTENIPARNASKIIQIQLTNISLNLV